MSRIEKDDLISRQKVLNIIDWVHYHYCFSPSEEWAFEYIKGLVDSCEDEVKHGKWIVVKRHEHYPSGKPYEQVQCPFCKRFDNNGDGSFCGYCGAMMERSEE